MEMVYYIGLPVVAAIVLFFGIHYWMARKRAELRESLQQDLAMTPGDMLIPPQKASFRGATERFGKIKNDGAAFLTSKMFVFRPLIGKTVINLEKQEIRSYREDVWFLTARHGNKKHLVLQLKDGTEVGFFVADNEQWKSALNKII